MTSGFINSIKVQFSVTLSIIITIEAILVLVISGQAKAPILGGDGAMYHQIAQNMLEHFSVSSSQTTPIEPTIYRAPGYPAFLAAIYLFNGHSLLAIRIAQLVLLGLTAYWLYCLALHFVDERTAKLSAWLCATYPPLVFLTTFHLTEVLATCASVGLILLVKKRVRLSDWEHFLNFSIGFTTGMLALIRPSLLLVIVPIMMAVAISNASFKETTSIQFRRAFLKLSLTALGFVLVLSPWLIRNVLLSHKFILTPTGPESLFCSMLQYKGAISYALTEKEWREIYFPEIYWKGQEEVDRKMSFVELNSEHLSLNVPRSVQKELFLNEFWQRRASEEFHKLTITRIISSLPKRLAYLWSTCDMAPLHLLAGTYHRLVQGQFVLLFLLTVSGAFLRRKNLVNEWLLWLFPTYVSLVHLFFHIEPRYSMPARPFILIYSAVGFFWILDAIRKGWAVSKQ